MKAKRFTAEQIINKLCQTEVFLSQGQNVVQVNKALGVTDQDYYLWRKEYGGIRGDQARRVQEG